MKAVNLTLAFAAAFLTACGQPPSRAVVTTTFQGAPLSILETSLTTLEVASGHDSFLHSNNPDFTIRILYGQLSDTILGEARPGDDECLIIINNKLQPSGAYSAEDLTHTLFHEIGHCFGLEHNPKSTEIMFWEYSRDQNTQAAFDNFIHDLNVARGK